MTKLYLLIALFAVAVTPVAAQTNQPDSAQIAIQARQFFAVSPAKLFPSSQQTMQAAEEGGGTVGSCYWPDQEGNDRCYFTIYGQAGWWYGCGPLSAFNAGWISEWWAVFFCSGYYMLD